MTRFVLNFWCPSSSRTGGILLCHSEAEATAWQTYYRRQGWVAELQPTD